jgi:transposase
MSMLKQGGVVRYLTVKNLSVAEITPELPSMYGTDALKYSTISKWRLRFQDGPDDLFDSARSGRPSRSDLAALTQSLLHQSPFISCKALCRKLKIGTETCLRELHGNLHREKFNLSYVQHSLEVDQTRSWVELSREPLQILEQDQQCEFEHMLTENETWFFLAHFHHSCWAANLDEAPEIPKEKFNPERTSFRSFGVAQGSKVCCTMNHQRLSCR